MRGLAGLTDVLEDVRGRTLTSFLDLARWLSAAIVCLGHLRDPLFLGYDQVAATDRNLFVKLWYFVTGWHAAAVIVFFVLSGFLVGGLGSARAQAGRFSPLDFAIDRVTRLFVAYWPALVLTALLDWLGYTYFGGAGFWNHTQAMLVQKVNAGAFQDAVTPQLFLANALMLQTFFTDVFGSNQPLWTISAEFWFYVVFGIVLSATTARSKGAIAVLVVAAIALSAVLGPQFLLLGGLWLIGVAAAFAPRRGFLGPIPCALLFLAMLASTRFFGKWFLSGLGLEVRNYSVALSFALLLISMRSVRAPWLEALSPINSWLAGFSYSVYLIHFPLMLFLMALLYETGAFPEIAKGYSPASPVGLAIYAGVVLAIFGTAYAFSTLTERQTGKVRRWAKAVFGPKTQLTVP